MLVLVPCFITEAGGEVGRKSNRAENKRGHIEHVPSPRICHILSYFTYIFIYLFNRYCFKCIFIRAALDAVYLRTVSKCFPPVHLSSYRQMQGSSTGPSWRLRHLWEPGLQPLPGFEPWTLVVRAYDPRSYSFRCAS